MLQCNVLHSVHPLASWIKLMQMNPETSTNQKVLDQPVKHINAIVQ